jgi:PAS domain S-box-containing protein
MISVLYVDDEQALLEIGKIFLELSGEFRVDCLTSVKNALEALKIKPYDAIVSDYQMPEEDGIDLLKIVRTEYPTLPFVMFTGKGREEIVIEAFNSGADFYVQKDGALQPQFADLGRKISAAVQSRQKDRALAESEEKYRNLVERANAGIIVIQDGKVRYRNQYLADLLGYTIEELQDKSPFDFIDRADVIRLKDYYARRTSGEQFSGTYETVLTKKDGTKIPVELNAGMVVYEGAQADLVIVQDITGRKQMEDALREREEQLNLALEGSGACLWDWQVQTGETVFNERWAEILGYTLQELAPISIETWNRLTHPDDLKKSNELIKKHFNGGIPRYECEVRMRHKDGHWIWVLDRGMVTEWDVDKRPVRMTGTHLGITARKQMEEALVESEEKYRLLTDRMNDIIWLLDLNLQTTYVSPSIKTILGFTSEERLISDVREQLTPESLAVVCGILKSELAKEQQEGADPDRTVKLELEYYHKDGTTRWLESVISTVRNRQGVLTGVHGVSRDITGRRQTDKALRQAHKQLNLLTSITRHDILNQILALKGYLELSGDFLDDPKRLSEFIKKEQTVASTIESHIALTREYEEMGVKEPAWQNTNIIIQQMCLIFPLQHVHIEPCGQDLEVFADPLFGRVIYNLIDNALQYAGDQLTTIRFSSHESCGNLVIVCEDDGAGISREDKTQLFRRGFGKHTGLGLFLSREILNITGMTIIENGEPGRGARFLITVPNGQYRNNSTGQSREGDCR